MRSRIRSFVLLPSIIFHHTSHQRLDGFLLEHKTLALVPAPGLFVLAHATQPDFIRQLLAREREVWGKLIREAGIKAD